VTGKRESELLADCANHAEKYRLLNDAYNDLKTMYRAKCAEVKALQAKSKRGLIELDKIKARHETCYHGHLIAQAHVDIGELIRFIEILQKREVDLLQTCAELTDRIKQLQSALDDAHEDLRFGGVM
jgi:predicted  nucleic acid-binding Zn-ribbon protein